MRFVYPRHDSVPVVREVQLDEVAWLAVTNAIHQPASWIRADNRHLGRLPFQLVPYAVARGPMAFRLMAPLIARRPKILDANEDQSASVYY